MEITCLVWHRSNGIVQLADMGVKQKRPNKPDDSAPLLVPADLTSAITESPKALATWDRFPRSARKDYILWVEEAKTELTRNRRIETTVEWLGEGKHRNWKYMKKQDS